jgi:predicted transposase/invertase (TIGR01784 family)
VLPTFADPKTDFVFKRIFGAEERKPLLIALLNHLLELEGSHCIRDVVHLSLEQHVAVPELKLSIVDVKCTDASGRRFVVEMQVAKVEGLEERIVYNASKAYVLQLRSADTYPALCDVVGVTICDFELWPDRREGGRLDVPMLSRWRMQEQHSGALGLPQVQYVFLELPKYAAGHEPQTVVDRWAYFFREARNLDVVPPALSEAPFRDALRGDAHGHVHARRVGGVRACEDGGAGRSRWRARRGMSPVSAPANRRRSWPSWPRAASP